MPVIPFATRLGLKKILQNSGWIIFAGLLTAVIFPYQLTAGSGFAIVGLGVSCIAPLIFSPAPKSTAMHTGQCLATISAIGFLGFLIVSPKGGFIGEFAGLRWSFALIAVLSIIIMWMVSEI